MKVLSFGSLNFDHVYQMDHFVMPRRHLPCPIAEALGERV